MNWWGYVTQVAGADQQNDIAAKLGVNASTVSRWKTTGIPGEPSNVAALARAYGRPVLQAFVAAGFLTSEEAKQRPTAPPSIGSLSDDQLVEEIRERLRKAGERDEPGATMKGQREAAAAQGAESGRRAGRQARENADPSEPDPKERSKGSA